jgi:hypothetical protein
MLRGTSFGIQAFAVDRLHGLLAICEKVRNVADRLSLHDPSLTQLNSALQGPKPSVHIYALDSLQKQATLTPGFQLGCAAVAFSGDGLRLAVCGEEPDAALHIYNWQEVCQATAATYTHLSAACTPCPCRCPLSPRAAALTCLALHLGRANSWWQQPCPPAWVVPARSASTRMTTTGC